MRTSRDLNWPKKIGGKYLQRSVFFAFMGIPLAMFISFVTENASVWIFLSSILGPLVLSQMAYGGGKPFPDQNIERAKIWLRNSLGANKFKVDVENWEGAVVSSVENGIFIGRGNTETYGFQVIVDPSQKKEKFYQTFYQELLRLIDDGVVVKDAITSVPLTSEYLTSRRSSLLEKGVCEQKRYLFVTFDELAAKETKRQILDKLAIGTRRLTSIEISAYMEAVAAPDSPPSGRESPVYTVSQVFDGKTIKVYPGEKRQGAVSLCTLPSQISEDFNLILADALNRHSIVTTTFKKREGFLADLKALTEGFFKVSQIARKKTTEELRLEEERIDRANSGDKANLHMFQSILMFDTETALKDRAIQLQNVRTRLHLSEEQAPIYMVDEGFVEESYRAALPSTWAYLPQRLQAVGSIQEASYYLPVEGKSAGRFSPLCFRTLRNTIRYIDVQDTSDAIMSLIVGGTGTGKSTLLGAYSDALDYLEEIGIATGKVTIDIGTSSGFQEDDEGVLSFNLANKNEKGDIAPYPVHPLHCALDPNKTNYTVKEKALARDQIIRMLGLKTSRAIAEGVIMDALELMIKHRDEYRLSGFRDIFLPLFKEKMESSNLTDELKMEWEHAIALLNKFCAATDKYKAGEYAHIFDPDQPSYSSLGDFKRLYFNMALGEEKIVDLATAHMNFAFLIGYSLCLKYDSESGDYHLFHFYVEEFQKARKYVDPTEFLELKNQMRKNGHLLFIVSQAFEHFMLPGLSEKEQQEIFKGIKEVYFGNISFEDDKAVLRTILTQDDEFLSEKFSEVKDVIRRLQKVIANRKSASLSEEKSSLVQEALSTFNIGYISPTREVETLHMDYEPEWLWQRTTHAAGRELRNKVMIKTGWTRKQASRALCRVLPSVPSRKLTDDEISKKIEQIKGDIDV